MNTTSELYGWVSGAFRLAKQSMGPAWPLSSTFIWWRHLEKQAIFNTCLISASPWSVLSEIGLDVHCKFDTWPYIFDLSFGKPVPTGPRRKHGFSLNLVACVQVYCPLCCKFSPQVWDSTLEPVQAAADASVCHFCNLHIWPWPSVAASISNHETSPVCYPSPLASNILFLHPNPKGHQENA